MDYKIHITYLAEKSFLDNIEYLQFSWTQKEVNKFILKYEEVINALKYNPFIFPEWNVNPKIRRALIVKQFTLFYEVNNHEIYLYIFWNNHQNLEKLKKLLIK